MSDTNKPDGSTKRRPFQFTLRQLLIAVTIVAVLCSLVAGLLHSHRSATEAAFAAACRRRLEHIGVCLRNYSRYSDKLPPAYLPDKDGKPMHSWRILVLGYDETKDPIYSMYRRNESWNSIHNANYTRGYSFYCCSHSSARPPMSTQYVAIIGPRTMWPGGKPSKLSWAVSDDTLLIAEIPDLHIHWAEPRDLTVDEFISVVRDLQLSPEKRPHPQGLHYLTVGGDVKTLPYDTSEAELRELVRANPPKVSE